jgi:hypothetical protein
MFGYTAEGAQQEADKFVEEAGDLEKDISNAASSLVPFYDSGVNIVNVAQEYMKPEQERDYEYIKDQFREAGQSAAIEGGLLLMGGVAGKYGAKGIKALADKVKQYEIDPTAMSAFGAGAIKKKTDKEMISVFPKPERMFPEESRPKGGDYLNPATGEVLSGRNVSSAKLSISPEGRPSFKVSNDNVEEVGSVGKGKTQIKTNLFKKKAGWKWTKAPEGMEDIATLISVENKGKHFYTIETDFSKGVNLKKYPNSKTEPRLRPTVVGEIEIGPQIGTISVRGKEHPVYQNIRTFNKGGAVMEDQMEMAFMQEGGIADDGMDVDPVSGNEVPPGSLAEEVRDDIPAQLSEGEYVVPADVVRYYGVKFFEDLRDQAKMGLAEMEANGRIGGEPVPAGGPINDQELSEQEMAAIREVMGMAEGGEVQNPYLQQQQLYSQPRPAPIDEKRNTTITNVNPVENQMPMQSMASGGQVQGYDSGNPVTQPDDDIPPFAENKFNPAQFGLGFSFMGQPQQTGTTTTQAPQGQTFTVLYHPDYATNGRSKTFYLPRDNEIYQQYLDMGYTKQMPMTGPAGQGETPTTDTPVTTETTGGSGGSGTNITTGGGTGKGFSFGFKNWGEDVDWTSSDAIMKFVEESQKGLIDPKTGNRLTAIGAVAGPLGAVAGATAGNLPTLQSISDLRASAIIARAQGLDNVAEKIDQQVEGILKKSSGITRFVDKFFNETVDGDAKGKAALDRLGFEYTVDSKTGNPTFSAEQITSNKAKTSKPEPSAPIKVENTFNTPTKKAAKKALKGSSRATNIQVGKAAARGASQKEQQKIRDEGAKVQAQLKDMASGKNTTGRTGFKEGGLMNKKGKKK